MSDWTPGQVKEHLEARLSERDRAIEMATDEREKAANALRLEMERAVKEGDERLREHISNQVMQIQAALESAEKLEVTRIECVNENVGALAEKLEVLREAQVLAQAKFERSVEGRFAQVNEFRGSLDDLGKQMATRRELETAVTSAGERMDEFNRQLGDLRSRIDIGPAALPAIQSRIDAAGGRQAGVQLSVGLLFGGLAALAAVVSIVVVVATVLAQ